MQGKNGYTFDKLWLYCSLIWLSITHMCKKKSIWANLLVRHSKLPPLMYFKLLRASYFMLLDRIWEWQPILNAGKNGYAFDKLWLYCSFIWLSLIYMWKKKSIRANLSARHSKLSQPIYQDFHIKILENQNNEQCNHNF